MNSTPLTELQKMIQADAKVDQQKLDEASLKAPYTYSRYVAIYATEKMWLKTYTKQFQVLNVKKTEYYKGNASEEEYKKNPLHFKVPPSKLSLFVAGDDEVQKLQNKLDTQEVKVEMLKEYMKVLYQTSFHIKNAIEFQKFINGGEI